MGINTKHFQFFSEGNIYCSNATFFCSEAGGSYSRTEMSVSLNRITVLWVFNASVWWPLISYLSRQNCILLIMNEAHSETLKGDCMKYKGKNGYFSELHRTEINMHTWNSFVFYCSIPFMNDGISPGFVIWDWSYFVATRSMTRDSLVLRAIERRGLNSGTYS